MDLVMEETLYLTELIDSDILQEVQDSFSKMTGIAAFITDAGSGWATKGSNLSAFCSKYTRASEEGCRRCKECDAAGTRLALKKGSAAAYRCHAGLVVFSAPIMIENRLIGCLCGGQFLDSPPDDEKIAKLAAEFGIDPKEYIAAVRTLPQLSHAQLQQCAVFLNTLTNVLSGIACHNYEILQRNAKIKRSTDLKSDFLANMSHEIRTPMNAVIGMAEMALREELTPAAQNYITQIRNSGKNLLAIINDILDFSKIESGKMEINMAEYEPMSLFNDMANIVMSHISNSHKNVQLVLDVPPDIPYEMLGDSLHIRQIFLNIANNAVKFTKEGYIFITIEFVRQSEDEILLQISIQDTGIGVKKADMDKLFQSFQQVDSKRNRNLEGTGLGLAISQRLLHLMMGYINVKSEYGKGSTFSFSLPQRIARDRPSITLKEPVPSAAAALIADPLLEKRLRQDIERLNVPYMPLESEKELADAGSIDFLFIDDALFTKQVEAFVQEHPEMTAVLIVDFWKSAEKPLPNVIIAKKPIYTLNLSMIFNREDLDEIYNDIADEDYEFTAPEARVLIVDDNSVNLTVAEGLLRPLRMQTDTARGGKDAIEKAAQKHYDLIFMDHQMPDLNGIEATHIIRRFNKEYENVPFIAFSADSSIEMQMMFLNEGLNDCVAKPFELRMLISKLNRWLPKEKIQKVNAQAMEKAKAPQQRASISIEGLDTIAALKIIRNERIYWAALKDYYCVIRKTAEKIRQLEQSGDWRNYTIEVHALKSSSKQIGAMELSDLAAEMEEAGNAENAQLIREKTPAMLKLYLRYDQILAPYFVDDTPAPADASNTISPDALHKAFHSLRGAMEGLDMDQMDSVIQELSKYYFDGWQKDLFEKLKAAVEQLDVDDCESILAMWENKEKE